MMMDNKGTALNADSGQYDMVLVTENFITLGGFMQESLLQSIEMVSFGSLIENSLTL